MITVRVAVASLVLAGAAWLVWYVLDHLLGHSLPAQAVSVLAAAGAGGWIYMRVVLAMRIPEAHQVRRLLVSRLGRA
jgi:putative peptidoglycan lipid II flippase